MGGGCSEKPSGSATLCPPARPPALQGLLLVLMEGRGWDLNGHLGWVLQSKVTYYISNNLQWSFENLLNIIYGSLKDTQRWQEKRLNSQLQRRREEQSRIMDASILINASSYKPTCQGSRSAVTMSVLYAMPSTAPGLNLPEGSDSKKYAVIYPCWPNNDEHVLTDISLHPPTPAYTRKGLHSCTCKHVWTWMVSVSMSIYGTHMLIIYLQVY